MDFVTYTTKAILNLKEKTGALTAPARDDFWLYIHLPNYDWGGTTTRGDIVASFTLVSELSPQKIKSLCHKANEDLESKFQTDFGSIVYNARFPSEILFIVICSESIDAETRKWISSWNPIDDFTHASRYTVPVFYDLGQERVFYFTTPSLWDAFKGALPWAHFREVITEVFDF